jgi:hypothetical protein
VRPKYDASSKWLIETFAAELLRLAGVGPVAAVKPLPGELVQAWQLPDGLVEVSFPGRAEPVLHLIEVNTFPYSRVPGELLDDVLLTYLDRRVVPEVIAVTLCEKGHVRIAPDIRVTSPLGHTRLEAAWLVVNLWELNAADFLPLTDPGMAPWIPLMKIDGPPEPVLQQCKDAIDTISPAGRKANLLGVTRVLGGLRFDDKLWEALFRVEGKMIESPVLQKWFRETEIEKRQAVILESLEAHFGGPVPADVSAAVRVVHDETRLKALLPLAYSSSTLDEFRKALSLPQSTN